MAAYRITRCLLPVCLLLIAGVNLPPLTAEPATRFLFVWAGDADHQKSDFLAVLDVTRKTGRYGEVLTSVPVGEIGVWPHHTEHELDASGMLFANGYAANRTFVFDLHAPLHPQVVTRFGSVNGLSFPHSFVRLPNGHVLATFQGHGDDNQLPGGIAELDDHGNAIRSVSVADPAADGSTLRPYSLAVVPALDRVVIGLNVMGIPVWHPNRPTIAHDHQGNQVQVRRLSDLSLVKTIALPTPDGPTEPRVLKDGRTVLVGTVSCRLYRVGQLATDTPTLELVWNASDPGCWVPIVIDHYWVQPNAETKNVSVLDVGDVPHPSEASSLHFDDKQRPHWLATDGERIVLVNDPTAVDHRIWMLQFDPRTGRLTLDTAFRNAGAERPGFSFDGIQWPHGATGDAVPHGTVFGR